MRIGEAKKRRLFDSQKIEKDVEVELIGSKNKKLWPILNSKNLVNIVVELRNGGSGLGVTLREVGGALTSNGLLGFGNFKCNWPEERAKVMKVIYRAELSRVVSNNYEFLRPYPPMRVKVSLDECRARKEKKLVECNLKLKNLKNLA